AAEAAQMEGLEPIAAHAQEPAPEGGWDQAAAGGSWDSAPTGEEAAPPSGDFGAAQDWSAEQPAAEPAPEQGWSDAAQPEGESAGEQLPMDAILGEAGSEQPAEEAAPPEPPPEETV